jgi:uncharacterized membrane protein
VAVQSLTQAARQGRKIRPPVRQSAARGGEQLAKALGWFSIALGLAEAAAPQGLARGIGVNDDVATLRLLRALGLRELLGGIGILLTRHRPVGWLWARVGGDAMDLALLGLALSSDRVKHGRAGAATAAVAGVTALDVFCGWQLSRSDAAKARTVRVTKTITVNRSPRDVYRFWRDLRNLPRFMSHLEEVHVLGDKRSRWRAKGPAGVTVAWDAEITEDVPNERIAWRSLEGADVDNAGTVHFKPGPNGRGTEVKVEIRYAPPAGRVGASILKLFGEAPGQQIREELRALKQLLETGEIARSGASFGWLAHAARPPGK